MKKNFIGLDGFIWFIGVVEDRQDPYMSGRVRVRCFGHYTGDKTDLPTEDLPWAQVMLPVTSAGISGIGQTPLGLVEGSHVFGFFRDGEARQEPVVMGSLPGYPMEVGDTTKGFYSPISAKEFADKVKQPDYWKSEEYSNYPRYQNKSDMNQLASYGDYSFEINPVFDLSKHPAVKKYEEFKKAHVRPIGIAITEPIQSVFNFLQTGGSTLFGFITDAITSVALGALGNTVSSALGTALGDVTKSVANLLGPLNPTPLLEKGIDFLTNPDRGVGFALSEIGDFTMETFSDIDGIINAEIFVPAAKITTSQIKTMTEGGFTQLATFTDTDGIRKVGFNVSNIEVAREFFGEDKITKNIDKFKKANEFSIAGITPTKVNLGIEKFNDDIDTVKEIQDELIEKANRELPSSADSDVIVNRDENGNVISITPDEGQQQEGISAKGGELKNNEKTLAGEDKLMNNFIANSGGRKDAWIMPDLPVGTKSKSGDVYPYRHVYETESGHQRIYDDNEGFASIYEEHGPSGTKYFISNDGTKAEHIMSDNAYTIEGNQLGYVRGGKTLSLGGFYKIDVNQLHLRDGHFEIRVGDNASCRIEVAKGDIDLVAKDGDINLQAPSGKIGLLAEKIGMLSTGDTTLNAGDDIELLAGDKIRLN